MEIDRVARDAWVIPQTCVRCGEPSSGGKSFTTYVTLKRRFNMDRTGQLESVATTSLRFDFPTCAACTSAQAKKQRLELVTQVVYWLLAIVGVAILRAVAPSNVVSCTSAVLVWFAVCLAIDRLTDSWWKRRADQETQRRAKLSRLPVSVKRRTAQSDYPLIRFTFENDEYGEMFAALNP